MTRFSSTSFSDFASKSKIPPELVAAGFEVGDAVGDGVEAFCFHEMLFRSGWGSRNYTQPTVSAP